MRDTAWTIGADGRDTRWLRGLHLSVEHQGFRTYAWFVAKDDDAERVIASGGASSRLYARFDASEAAKEATDDADLGDATGAYGSRAAWQVAS